MFWDHKSGFKNSRSFTPPWLHTINLDMRITRHEILEHEVNKDDYNGLFSSMKFISPGLEMS